ncbi:protein PLASTID TRANSCRIPTIONALLY ACTIVE 7-like isoform X1 [Cucurbita maxima]|uniref:Protein PLASTID TRANSCRIPTIONALLY ACTIVE 7-like isoform X1 n=1 Tax=Cucurbita maxima TaxID=3661 RepID=A0A6J1J5H1_CUCMA|nr:protein PLASTID TRANSCRIPTIONALLY ACTIVE 7-like isoform X1 [Cucurbita maxima]
MTSPIPTLSFASPLFQRIQTRAGISHGFNFPPRLQVAARKQRDGEGVGRRVWRRRKLTKKDEMSIFKMDRIPFLEEQVRKVKEQGKLITMDIERLLLSEDNRFDFVNEVAAEAKEYVENNRDEYGGSKKAILHVLSNRVNDAGFYRPDAYAEEDPFKPGPHYLKQEFT